MQFYPFNPKNRTCIDQKTPEIIQIKQKKDNFDFFYGYLLDFTQCAGRRIYENR